jgi:hypothetical protein
MQKNKIILVIALGLMISPVLALHAEETVNTTASTNVTTQLPVNNEINQAAKDNRQAIIDKAKQERDNIKTDLKAKLGDIKNSTTATLDQKKAEITDLKNKTIEDLKNSKIAIQEELKANLDKKITALKANIDARKTELEKNITEKSNEIKVKLAAKAQEKVKATLENIYSKLTNQVENLNGVDVKIQARIDTAAKNGKDVSAAKAQYAIAKAALDKAIVDVSATKTISIDQTTTATSKDTLRSLVKTVEDSMKAAGVEYKKVLPLIPTVETGVSSTSVTQ